MPKKHTSIIPLKKPEPPQEPPEPASKVDWRDHYEIKWMFGYDGRSITIHAELVDRPDPIAPQIKREGRVLKIGKRKEK